MTVLSEGFIMSRMANNNVQGFARISSNALQLALSIARGVYQRDLILGVEALSGSTLRGKAKSYSGRYRESAANLKARLRAAGFIVSEETIARRRTLCVSLPCEEAQ